MQVEQRFDPQLRGRPCAVVQYNNYEARSFGVARGMWASEARALCPELLLARVPEARGKADLSRYREASAEVMEVLSRFAAIERASIDEAYLDLTGSARDRLRELTSSETRITIIGHLQNEYEEKMKRKRSNSSRKERGHVSL
uniref:UmuC domain-containing protein n=1 Tax=Anas zonorhyncha TaxID=75864 RepID=A0A8B9UJ75_9AVES